MTTAKTLRREHFYPDPPSRVWVALTDPHALAEWLMPNNFKPVLGHKFIFQIDPMPLCAQTTECEVIECDPPRRLAYTWTIVPSKPGKPRLGPMIVRWSLEPHEGGTRLIFEHEGIDRIPWWMGMLMRFGWGTIHKRMLPKIFRNIAADGSFTPGVYPLKKRCYKCKTIRADLAR